MLTVAQARAAITEALTPLPVVGVSLAGCRGRVLRQRVYAERDQPPYDRVMMDGVALRHAVLAAGRREYAVAGTQHAGDEPLPLHDETTCIEIMTGAVLPPGADCIVPVERTAKSGGRVTIEADYAAQKRQFVHPRASDHAAGTVLLEPGRILSAIDVALVASAGLAEVEVCRLPRVRVVSTGNELVPAGRPLADHQVRLSNGPAIVAMLDGRGFTDSAGLHLPDDPAALERDIGSALAESDVLVLSGGVSMGQADFVPGVLDRLGVERVFHGISQRPGKPMWFGKGPEGQLVFALPGNPVSALTCCRHYVLPALLAASGAAAPAPVAAVLTEEFRFRPGLTCFLPVRAAHDDEGRLRVTPRPTNTSGDFTALAATDGYVELEKERELFAAGSVLPYYAWD